MYALMTMMVDSVELYFAMKFTQQQSSILDSTTTTHHHVPGITVCSQLCVTMNTESHTACRSYSYDSDSKVCDLSASPSNPGSADSTTTLFFDGTGMLICQWVFFYSFGLAQMR